MARERRRTSRAGTFRARAWLVLALARHVDRLVPVCGLSSISPAVRDALTSGGFIGGKSRHQAFADLNVALAWCEDKLVDALGESDTDLDGFTSWLQRQLGADVKLADLLLYFDGRNLDDSTVLYRQGEAADTIDLVAAGHLAVDVTRRSGESVRVRRLATHTVIGEMGFFRNSARSSTVSSQGPTVLFTLTRAHFERMRKERADLAIAFRDFMIRVLADRIDTRDREIAALEPVMS